MLFSANIISMKNIYKLLFSGNITKVSQYGFCFVSKHKNVKSILTNQILESKALLTIWKGGGAYILTSCFWRQFIKLHIFRHFSLNQVLAVKKRSGCDLEIAVLERWLRKSERQRKGERIQDLHTHLLSSNNIRSPRQLQFTTPSGVRRQRSWHPPLFTLQGDDSPGSMKKSQMTHHMRWFRIRIKIVTEWEPF